MLALNDYTNMTFSKRKLQLIKHGVSGRRERVCRGGREGMPAKTGEGFDFHLHPIATFLHQELESGFVADVGKCHCRAKVSVYKPDGKLKEVLASIPILVQYLPQSAPEFLLL